jgi:hypothetical protein
LVIYKMRAIVGHKSANSFPFAELQKFSQRMDFFYLSYQTWIECW